MAFLEGFQTGANIKQQREALRQQKEMRDQELQRLGYSFENGQMQMRSGSMAEAEQLEAKQATQLAKSLQGKLAAQDTDTALEEFALSGDASAMQRALDNNPYLKKAWGDKGVQMLANLDFQNDKALLSSAGLSPSAYDTPDKQDIIRKNLYKYYNGKEWTLGMLSNAVGETGALSRLGQRRGKVIVDNAKQLKELLGGPKANPYSSAGHKYEKEIQAAADETGLHPDIIAAMMHVESSGRPEAVSGKGATGLMQLMEDAASEVGVTDRTDPAQNIMGGAKYLKKMLDRFDGDLELALAAYNAGPGNVRKYGGVPPFPETQNYIQKIRAGLDESQSFYNKTADTIFEHMRAKANAAKGLTNEQVDQQVRLETVKTKQDMQLNQIKTEQTERELGQKDRALDQTDMSQWLTKRGQDIKLATDGSTTTQKDLAAADTVAKNLVEPFGSEEDFFNADLSDPKVRRDALNQVIKIEQLTGTEPSEADKKTITELRELMTLANPVVKLTASQTGLIDKQISGVTKYFSDNIEGVEAKAALQTFRNTLRHALFGSALTEAEITAFNEAAGHLGYQLGPVLAHFRTSVEQLKTRLESTGEMMNPYSAKVRLGKDQVQLGKILQALDERLNYISKLHKGALDDDKAQEELERIFVGGE